MTRKREKQHRREVTLGPEGKADDIENQNPNNNNAKEHQQQHQQHDQSKAGGASSSSSSSCPYSTLPIMKPFEIEHSAPPPQQQHQEGEEEKEIGMDVPILSSHHIVPVILGPSFILDEERYYLQKEDEERKKRKKPPSLIIPKSKQRQLRHLQLQTEALNPMDVEQLALERRNGFSSSTLPFRLTCWALTLFLGGLSLFLVSFLFSASHHRGVVPFAITGCLLIIPGVYGLYHLYRIYRGWESARDMDGLGLGDLI